MSKPVTRLRVKTGAQETRNQSISVIIVNDERGSQLFLSSEHAWMERSVVNAITPPVTPPQRTGTQKAKKFRHWSDVMRGLEICRYSTFI